MISKTYDFHCYSSKKGASLRQKKREGGENKEAAAAAVSEMGSKSEVSLAETLSRSPVDPSPASSFFYACFLSM